MNENANDVNDELKANNSDIINNENNNDNNEDNNSNYFDNNGIRKAILLIEYVKLLQKWISFENKKQNSTELKVNKAYKQKFKEFQTHFGNEMKAINDNSLKQELKILAKLSK